MFDIVLAAITRRAMSPHEPTLAELLSDGIVQAVMKADGVDAKALAADLRKTAECLGGGHGWLRDND